jgi:prepilin-type N-terminal cleavage/methylation domain-containing protein
MQPAKQNNKLHNQGFTLIEALVSVAIFGLLMMSVAALWTVCWRATERISRDENPSGKPDLVLKRLSEAVEASVHHEKPKDLYVWKGESGRSGEVLLSFVTSFPPDAAEISSQYGALERIEISATATAKGNQLIMKAGPFTMKENEWQRKTVLFEEIEAFRVRFWSEKQKDWVDDWTDEENAPSLVQMGLAMKGDTADGDLESWKNVRVARVYPTVDWEKLTKTGSSTNNPPSEATNPQ